MKEIEKNLKALANRKRLGILKHLKDKKEATIEELAEIIDLSYKATSRHLRVLALVDIIDKKQQGPRMVYFLEKNQKFLAKQTISIL